MDCRIATAHKFRTRLVFKQYNVVLTKAQSLLTKKSSFENMQHNTVRYGYRIGCKIDLYFMTINLQGKLMKMDLVMEILNMNQKDKNQLGREFIRIDSYKKDF